MLHLHPCACRSPPCDSEICAAAFRQHVSGVALVAGITHRLLVFDERQLEQAALLIQRRLQLVQVDPQVVGVEELVPVQQSKVVVDRCSSARGTTESPAHIPAIHDCALAPCIWPCQCGMLRTLWCPRRLPCPRPTPSLTRAAAAAHRTCAWSGVRPSCLPLCAQPPTRQRRHLSLPLDMDCASHVHHQIVLASSISCSMLGASALSSMGYLHSAFTRCTPSVPSAVWNRQVACEPAYKMDLSLLIVLAQTSMRKPLPDCAK
jgi:hypothetical protein